jgi:hypothetical protein
VAGVGAEPTSVTFGAVCPAGLLRQITWPISWYRFTHFGSMLGFHERSWISVMLFAALMPGQVSSC